MRRVEAVVQTGPIETRYTLAGKGAPVLVLLEDGAASAIAMQLLEVLTSDYRLLLPSLDSRVAACGDHDAFSSWLRNFMDGLGIDRFVLVARAQWSAAIAAFMATDPDRVERLIVFTSRDHGPALLPYLPRHLLLAANGHLAPESIAALLGYLRAPLVQELSAGD
jgi:pimeloyl-ACP methyl ester carboxylesterase